MVNSFRLYTVVLVNLSKGVLGEQNVAAQVIARTNPRILCANSWINFANAGNNAYIVSKTTAKIIT